MPYDVLELTLRRAGDHYSLDVSLAYANDSGRGELIRDQPVALDAQRLQEVALDSVEYGRRLACLRGRGDARLDGVEKGRLKLARDAGPELGQLRAVGDRGEGGEVLVQQLRQQLGAPRLQHGVELASGVEERLELRRELRGGGVVDAQAFSRWIDGLVSFACEAYATIRAARPHGDR